MNRRGPRTEPWGTLKLNEMTAAREITFEPVKGSTGNANRSWSVEEDRMRGGVKGLTQGGWGWTEDLSQQQEDRLWFLWEQFLGCGGGENQIEIVHQLLFHKWEWLATTFSITIYVAYVGYFFKFIYSFIYFMQDACIWDIFSFTFCIKWK